MRFAILLTIFITATALAGGNESREEMIDRLFPASSNVSVVTEQFYKIVAVNYPHVAPDKAKEIIEKHLRGNESLNRELKQKQWSEQNWSNGELEVAARMIHDPSNAIAIAGSEDAARRISIKIYETQQKSVTPEMKEKASEDLDKLNAQLQALESQADS